MSIRKTGKLWLGIGTAAVIGVGVAPSWSSEPASPNGVRVAQAPADATAKGDPHAGHGQAATSASQGGEGGEAGGAGLDPRIRFFRDMELVRGHLLVGGELVEAGLWNDALPHFHHPTEELYPKLGELLKIMGVRQFDGPLKALAQTVKARNPAAYVSAAKLVEQRMAEVDKAMRKHAEPYLQSRMKIMIAVLQTAAGEYGQSIENERIAKPVEYQDSRGFVLQVSTLLAALAPELGRIDAASLANVERELAELRKVWPTPLPPEKPVKSQADVLANVARIELEASAFLK